MLPRKGTAWLQSTSLQQITLDEMSLSRGSFDYAQDDIHNADIILPQHPAQRTKKEVLRKAKPLFLVD